MDTKTRTTKQGLRDLNFYGSRKKLAEDAAAIAGPEGDARADVAVPADTVTETAPIEPDTAAVVAPAGV